MAKKDKDTRDRFVKNSEDLKRISVASDKKLGEMRDKSNKQDVRELKEFRGQTIKQKKDAADQRIRDLNEKKFRAKMLTTERSSSLKDIKTEISKGLKLQQRSQAWNRLKKGAAPDTSGVYGGGKSAIPMAGTVKLQSIFKQLQNTMTSFKTMVKPGSGGQTDADNPVAKGMKSMLKFAVGGSIVGMIGKKLFDSSPLLKAMMSLFNTSIMLIFRPIGDMIGGFLRPIMLFFMKNIVIPFYKANKGLGKLGEKYGKMALGFFLKPAETIYSAIMKWALDSGLARVLGFEEQARKHAAYDPIKAWKEENNIKDDGKGGLGGIMSGIASGGSFTGQLQTSQQEQLKTQEEITGAKQEEAILAGDATVAAEEVVASSKQSSDYYSLVGALAKDSSTSAHEAAGWIDAIAKIFEKKTNQLNSLYRTKIKQGNIQNKNTSRLQQERAGLMSLMGGGTQGMITPAMMSGGGLPTAISGKMISSGTSLAEINRKAEIGHQVRLKEKELTSQGLSAGLVKENFSERVEKIYSTMGVNANSARIVNKMAQDMVKKYGGHKLNLGTAGWSILNKVQEAKNLDTVKFGKETGFRDAMSTAMALGNTAGKQSAMDMIGMANGGIINEPIFGIGASGKRYSFGERGAETVTPGVGASNVININIGNVSRDADFEKLKPMIQRWLLESHSRRGVI